MAWRIVRNRPRDQQVDDGEKRGTIAGKQPITMLMDRSGIDVTVRDWATSEPSPKR